MPCNRPTTNTDPTLDDPTQCCMPKLSLLTFIITSRCVIINVSRKTTRSPTALLAPWQSLSFTTTMLNCTSQSNLSQTFLGRPFIQHPLATCLAQEDQNKKEEETKEEKEGKEGKGGKGGKGPERAQEEGSKQEIIQGKGPHQPNGRDGGLSRPLMKRGFSDLKSSTLRPSSNQSFDDSSTSPPKTWTPSTLSGTFPVWVTAMIMTERRLLLLTPSAIQKVNKPQSEYPIVLLLKSVKPFISILFAQERICKGEMV